MSQENTLRSNGKLLLTGEYLVLEGAEALAVPLGTGQNLIYSESNTPGSVLIWEAIEPRGIWFTAHFKLPELEILNTTDAPKAGRLKQILLATKKINPDFLNKPQTVHIKTTLEFSPEYGFGSSSTLIANLARLSGVDPWLLLQKTFGGSGYDVAAALSDKPIVYKLENNKPVFKEVDFDPPFADRLFAVYLGHKKNSREGIRYFKQHARFRSKDIENITRITRTMVTCREAGEFVRLVNEHEKIISSVLQLPTAKETFFKNTNLTVKSLGAWGGDFVLVLAPENDKFFIKKLKSLGFSITFAWHKLMPTP